MSRVQPATEYLSSGKILIIFIDMSKIFNNLTQRNSKNGVSIAPAWLEQGAPILPRSLRIEWEDDPLPQWLINDLQLQVGATMKDLGTGVKIPAGPANERLQRYLSLLLETRRESAQKLPAVGEPWPASLEFTEIRWRTRTRNCIAHHGLEKRLTELPYITFGELFNLRSMGGVSILDFACTLESAIVHAGEGAMNHHELDMVNNEETLSANSALWEALDEPWADRVSEKDPRFFGILPLGQGTIAERIDQLTSTPDTPKETIELLAAAIPLVRARITELEQEPLDVGLEKFLEATAKVKGPRLQALSARLHLSGDANSITLEEAGERTGVTRERVRQIQSRFFSRLPDHPILMPALDKGLRLLTSRVPISVDEASRVLAAEGISTRPFHPASLIAAATICRRTPSIHIEDVLGTPMLVALSIGRVAEKIARIAYRQASACGASNTSEVRAELVRREQGELSEEEIYEILVKFSGAEFLQDTWFWFPQRPNDAIRDISRKILSVTAPVEVGTLREGIRRALRFRQSIARKRGSLLIVPPRSVLMAYYRAHPEFVVMDNELIKTVHPLDYRSEIRGIEKVLVEVLQSTPAKVMDRASFAESCLERGLNTNSLWIMTTYSPVIEHLGIGLWTLRGTKVDPTSIEAVRQANALRPRERRIVDFGWLPDGKLWVAIRLPQDFANHIFGIPAAVKRFLADRDFDAFTEDGVPCGRIRIYDYGTSAGYTTFLKRAGADEGDLLLAKFDLVTACVCLSVTDDEGLEAINPII